MFYYHIKILCIAEKNKNGVEQQKSINLWMYFSISLVRNKHCSCLLFVLGVLFGLKVVNNHYHPGGATYVMGLPIANRYSCWVELVLIHVLNPG